MRHRVAPLTALALFFLYLVGRIAIVMQGKVFTSFDTFSYAYRNDPQWDRGALVSFIGDAPRPWGVPLFFALFPDDQSRAIGQWVVGTVAWALLAWTLYSLLRHPLAKVLSVGAILLLGLLRPVASWDFAILSESLSISLGVLTLALFLWWLRHRAWWTLAAMVLVAIWWMFTRVDIFVLVLPLAAVLAVLAWRNRDSPQARNAALAGGAVLAVAAAFSYLVVGPSSMKAHERWSFTPELNQETGLTMYRLRLSVFPDPEVKSFFEAELGMPKCDAADRVAAGPEWDIEGFSRAVAACPSLREWVEQHRQGLWTDYATGAPGPFVRQIAQLTSDALTGAAYAPTPAVIPAIIDKLAFPRQQTLLFTLAGLALALALAFASGARRAAAALMLTATAIALTALASAVLTVVVSSGEVWRFGLQEAIAIRIAIVMLLAIALDAWMAKRTSTSTR
jgi:hypothetical protein